jgi:hypothetical protein
MTWRRGLAIIVLPLALLSCSSSDEGDGRDGTTAEAEGDATTTTTTTTGAAAESDLPDICTLVSVAQVEEIMQATPGEPISTTHDGGGRSCSWPVEGTTACMGISVHRSTAPEPDAPGVDGCEGEYYTEVGSERQAPVLAVSYTVFPDDIGRDVRPALRELNAAVLAAVG